jgi:NAD(P)-dependent dehydrogenase (short-subunit alcohol dehydrogenase family)
MGRLDGKVALVTGAGSKRGIGRAVAVRLAKEGAKVAVVDKEMVPKSIWPGDEDWGGLKDVIKEIESVGSEGLAIVCDVSKSEDVERMVKQVLERFGKIDILVHCAAIRGPINVPLIETSEEAWRRTLEVNATGTFLVTKAVANAMIRDGRPEGRKIVLICALAGIGPYPGSVAYCASKHAVAGLGRTLALELAKYKINVNLIHPGPVETNLRDEYIKETAQKEGISIAEAAKKVKFISDTPLGRIGTPEDIANAVLFLVSDEANWITGSELVISGGLRH